MNNCWCWKELLMKITHFLIAGHQQWCWIEWFLNYHITHSIFIIDTMICLITAVVSTHRRICYSRHGTSSSITFLLWAFYYEPDAMKSVCHIRSTHTLRFNTIHNANKLSFTMSIFVSFHCDQHQNYHIANYLFAVHNLRKFNIFNDMSLQILRVILKPWNFLHSNLHSTKLRWFKIILKLYQHDNQLNIPPNMLHVMLMLWRIELRSNKSCLKLSQPK